MSSTNVIQSRDSLQNELKTKKICRFCLSQQSDILGSIYLRDGRIKSSAPLPVQVMACASIEVFSNDGMPSCVCNDCRLLFEHSYRFKQMCKRADTLLRQYPLTGEWPSALAKPKIPQRLALTVAKPQQEPVRGSQTNPPISTTASSNATESSTPPAKKPVENLRKKILNADPAESPEPPVPMRMKKEKLDEETTLFLDKMENNEELSMDDVQRLIAAADENMEMKNENVADSPQKTPKPRPKLLNKSSIRILNKNADVVVEPRLSAPQLKRDVDGKVAMVTEILDPNTTYTETEPDRIKNAAPVETVVFPCPHCERSFPLRQLRDIHMVNHTRSRRFQCPECDKSFFSKYDLQKHNLIHTGDRPYKCTACDKAFTRATLLHRHEKTHTDVPKFICIHCEKPFISKDQMEKHAERHLKNRPYQCEVCNKSFAFKQGLERHEVIHSREQPYPCQYCEESFSTPSKLARHLTAHAGKRPYPCKFCSKSYLLSHHLTRHMRSHKNGVVSFMCGDCNKVFKSRDELIYHSAVHATQTLICPLCKEHFEDIQSVTVHIREHAEGEAYACEFCDLLFMTAERLQQHTDTDHVDDMVAYHEDEQSRPPNKNEEESNKSFNVKELEETIEEFLIDELPDDAQILSDQKLISGENSKGGGTEIISQIVLNPNSFEDKTMLDENNAEIESDNDQPPAKIKKVVSSTAKRVSKVVEQSTQLRRKVATGSTEVTKSEKEVSNTPQKTAINSVLKLLPKGVSVRRNTPNNESTITTPSGPTEKQTNKTQQLQNKPQQGPTRSSTRLSSESIARVMKKPDATASGSPINNKEVPSKRLSTAKSPNINTTVTQSNQNAQKSSVVEKSPQNATSSQQRSPTKTVKMMLGDKKVKVQKITITKAEAAAMAKDGRIRMKDGAMILTKPTK